MGHPSKENGLHRVFMGFILDLWSKLTKVKRVPTQKISVTYESSVKGNRAKALLKDDFLPVGYARYAPGR